MDPQQDDPSSSHTAIRRVALVLRHEEVLAAGEHVCRPRMKPWQRRSAIQHLAGGIVLVCTTASRLCKSLA